MRFPVPNDSESLQRALRVSQAVNRVRQLPTVFSANILLATFIAAVYWDLVERSWLFAFVAVMTVLWTPAILSWRRLRNRPRPESISTGNEWRALAFSATAGVLWAVAAWQLYPAGQPYERAAIAMLLSGLCAGSVAFFSSSPAPSMGFFLPFMLALFAQSSRFDASEEPVLPAAIGVFILCALLFTRMSWVQFVENVRVIVERDRALDEVKANEIQLGLALSRMEDLAMVDELTGLKNRRAFFDDADPAIAGCRRRDQPVTVAVLDLDHFKQVNDTKGHAIGDVVLKAAALRITDTLRGEQIVGRMGGEEFVVLLPATTPQQALTALERVRKVMGETPIETASGSVTITVSGGIAALGPDQLVETAIDHADKAMYRAKSLGRDRVEVYAGM